MDLIQRKLTKSEWEGIEVPVSANEKEILSLIKNGFNDINIRYNNNQSLITYMRIDVSDAMHVHLYEQYFAKTVKELCKNMTYQVLSHHF